MSRKSIFIVGGLLALIFAGCAREDGGNTVNLALYKSATATSNYDYNLTAQLVTDGIISVDEPAWLKVTTASGELPKREKEWTLDTGPYSRNTLDGEDNFIEYEWSGQKFSAACVRIVGTLVYKEGSSGWSVRCLSGGDELKLAGSMEGEDLPGRQPIETPLRG